MKLDYTHILLIIIIVAIVLYYATKKTKDSIKEIEPIGRLTTSSGTPIKSVEPIGRLTMSSGTPIKSVESYAPAIVNPATPIQLPPSIRYPIEVNPSNTPVVINNVPAGGKSYEIAVAWAKHILYIRLAIMAYLSDDAEINLIIGELLQIQKKIGSLMSTIYGIEMAQTLTNSLSRHVQLVMRYCKDMQYGTEIEQQDSVEKLRNNLYFLADALDQVNNSKKFRYHFEKNADALIYDINAYLANDYKRDLQYLDYYVNTGMAIAFDMM